MVTQAEISIADEQGPQGSPHWSTTDGSNVTHQGMNLSFTTVTKMITHISLQKCDRLL